MQKCFACAAVAVTFTMSASFATPAKDEFIARENAVWNAFKNKDAAEVKKLVSTDLVAVYPDGIYNFQQRLDGMSKMTMKSFSFGNFNVSMLSNEVAIVSYKAKVENKDGSSSDLNCGTVWNLKNGGWRAVFHADMPVAP